MDPFCAAEHPYNQCSLMSFSLSRPGRFTQDSGRQKKIGGAMGTPDMPFVMGGVMHAHRKPCGKSRFLYILNAHKAFRVPRHYIAKHDSAHAGPSSRLWGILHIRPSEGACLTQFPLQSTPSWFLTIQSKRGCLLRGSMARRAEPCTHIAQQQCRLQQQATKTRVLPPKTARTHCHSVVRVACHSCRGSSVRYSIAWVSEANGRRAWLTL